MKTVLTRISLFLCLSALFALPTVSAKSLPSNNAGATNEVSTATAAGGLVFDASGAPVLTVCQGGSAALTLTTVGLPIDHWEQSDAPGVWTTIAAAGVGATFTDPAPINGRQYRVACLFTFAPGVNIIVYSNAAVVTVTPTTPAPATPVAITPTAGMLGAYCLGQDVAFATTPGSTLNIAPFATGNGTINQGTQTITTTAAGGASVFSTVVGCLNGNPAATILSPNSALIKIDNPGSLVGAPGSLYSNLPAFICQATGANNFTAIADPTVACNGAEKITYSSTPAATITANGLVTFAPTYFNYPPLAATAQVTASATGCLAGGTYGAIGALTAAVLVAQQPTATLTPVSPATICNGAPFTFSIALDNGGSAGNTTINLSDGTTVVAGIGQNPVQVTRTPPVGMTTYSITSITRSYSIVIPFILNLGPIVCTGTATGTAKVTVINNTPASLSISPANPTICVPPGSIPGSGSVTLTAVSADPTITTFQWSVNGNPIVGATTNTLVVDNSATKPANGTYTVSAITVCGQIVSPPVTITINAPVTITTQPANASVCLGSTATFTVVAAGTGPLTYQWCKNGAPILGATAATFTTGPTTNADNGALYNVKVTNACGTVASANATLTVTPLTAITVQPVSQSICLGSAVTFSVTATGTPALTYQWFFNNVAIAGATNATLTIASVTVANGGNYTVVVTGPCGVVTSNVAVLTILARPTAALSTAGATTVCAGGQVPLDVTFGSTAPGGATGPWKITFSDGKSITGVVNNPFQYDATPAASTTYTITSVMSANGCMSIPADLTGAVAVIVNPLTAITTQPVGKTGCAGQAAPITLSVVATGGNLTYQWRKAGQNIFNATAATLTIPAAVASSGVYDVVVSGACGTVISNQATVTIYPAPVGGTLNGGGITVCAMGNAGVLTLVGSSGNICGWQSAPTAAGPWTNIGNAGNATLAFANLTQTTYYRVLIGTDPGCTLCTAFSTVAKITVDAVPVPGTITGSHTVCLGKTVTLTDVGSLGTVVKWQYTSNLQGGWFDIPGTSGALTITAGQIHSFTPTWYRVVVSNGTCTMGMISAPFLVTPIICLGAGGSSNALETTMISKVYPSPTHNLATLEVQSPVDGKVTLEVFDMLGRAVVSRTESVYQGANDISINLSEMNVGVYLIRVTDEKAKINTVKITRF